MRIVLTAGGTGGHLFPIIAVAREIKELIKKNVFLIPPGEGANVELIFLGPLTIGEEALAKENIDHKKIMAGKVRRYASGQNLVDLFRVPIGFFQSLWYLFFLMPNVIFSKGGYGSVPVILAAWVFRIPVLIHESDSVPGLANRFCAKFAKRVAISFNESANYFPKEKIALTGNPVRLDLAGGSKEGAKRVFGINGTKPVISILGGSQGAQALNDVIFASLPALLERCEIIHQCGKNNFEVLKQLLGNNIPAGYFLYPFLNEEQLRETYGAADLIISRAGAGNISEIAFLGKPCIIIPLPNSASDHQLKNAMEYSLSGAALILDQMNLTPHLLQHNIFSLLDDTELLKKMGESAKKFAQPDAGQKIAQELLNIAKW